MSPCFPVCIYIPLSSAAHVRALKQKTQTHQLALTEDSLFFAYNFSPSVFTEKNKK